jgi:hypothetical protein
MYPLQAYKIKFSDTECKTRAVIAPRRGHIHVLHRKFANGKGCIEPLRWIPIDPYWIEIKAVFDHFQNFVWSQFRGLYVTLASMWALGFEPTGLKLCRAFPWLYINEKQPGYDIFRP